MRAAKKEGEEIEEIEDMEEDTVEGMEKTIAGIIMEEDP